MTKEELKKWFWNQFNSCVWLEHEKNKGNYYLIYDKNFLRQKKLCRLTGTNEIKFILRDKNLQDCCLFYLDFKNGYFNCDYDKIWLVFYKNNFIDYNSVKGLIKSMLLEYDKLNVLTPFGVTETDSGVLLEYDKLNVLTPFTLNELSNTWLLEYDKLNVLTPTGWLVKKW